MNITKHELYWLVGLLEGEGHFRLHVTRANGTGSPKIDLKMTDEDVMYRAADIMSRLSGKPCLVTVNYSTNYKDSFQIQIYGERAMSVMRAIVKLMGNRRRKQIWQALNRYSPNHPFRVAPQQKEANAFTRS